MASKNRRNISSNQASFKERSIWSLLVLIVLAAFWLDVHYSSLALPLRISGWIVVICIILPMLGLTKQGAHWKSFIQLAYLEMKKVTWPVRSEVIQMTWVVAAFVAIASLILWSMDAFLSMLISVLSDFV